MREFGNFVLTGGEVTAVGLDARIREAWSLVLAVSDGCLVGTAALKNPDAAYQRRVFENAKAHLSLEDFPLELGWVLVSKEHRGHGVSGKLVDALLDGVTLGVYSTSRSDNVPMHRTLQRFDFMQHGQSYPSKQNRKALLSLFLRAART